MVGYCWWCWVCTENKRRKREMGHLYYLIELYVKIKKVMLGCVWFV